MGGDTGLLLLLVKRRSVQGRASRPARYCRPARRAAPRTGMPMPKHCIQFIRFIALINCTHTRWPCTRSTGYRRGKAAAGSAPACSRGPSRRCCCTPRTDRAQAAARAGWGLGRARRRCTRPAPPPTCSSGSAMLCEHRHSSHTGKHQRPSQRHRAAVGLVCRLCCCTMLGSESGCSRPCVEAAGGSQRS